MHTILGCKITNFFSIMQMFFCLKCFFVDFVLMFFYWMIFTLYICGSCFFLSEYSIIVYLSYIYIVFILIFIDVIDRV